AGRMVAHREQVRAAVGRHQPFKFFLVAAYKSFQAPPRPLATVSAYSRTAFKSSSPSLATAPTSERATSSAVTAPEPNDCARMPLWNRTLIASAVDRTDAGGLTLVLPSLVTPARISWNSVTSRRASSSEAGVPTW